MPAPHKSTDNRQHLIRLIHVAKRDLRMAEDVYRATLQRIGGKESAADLSIPKLEAVLEHMKRCGFKVRSKAKPAPAKAKPSRPLARDPESKKIRALWLFLHQLGVVKNPSEEALAAYVKRLTGVDALQWIDGEQAEKLIETMKKWAMRFLPQAVEDLAKEAAALPLSDLQRAQLNTVLSRAFQRRTFDPMQYAWESLNEVIKKARGAL
jgi:phage gp16-like protein